MAKILSTTQLCHALSQMLHYISCNTSSGQSLISLPCLHVSYLDRFNPTENANKGRECPVILISLSTSNLTLNSRPHLAKTSLNSQTEQDHHQDRPPPRMVAWPLAVLGGSVCMATHSEMPNLKDGNDLRWHLRFENTFRPAIVVFSVQTSGGLKWKRTARLDCEPIHDDMTKPSCQPVAPNSCTLIARRRSFKRAMIKRQQTGMPNRYLRVDVIPKSHACHMLWPHTVISEHPPITRRLQFAMEKLRKRQGKEGGNCQTKAKRPTK
jgi:hypothetical protein